MFKIGQKVVCLQTSYLKNVIKGEIYTITEIFEEMDMIGLNFKETTTPLRGFNSIHFKPLDDNFAENVLSEVLSKVKEEQLELV